MAVDTGQFAALAQSFFLGRGDGLVPVGRPEERHETAHEEADLWLPTEEGLAQPVALRGPAPAGRNALFLLEDPRFISRSM